MENNTENKNITTLEYIFFTSLVVSLTLLFPLIMIYRSPTSEILSLNTLLPILLISLFIPLLDLIYSFDFFRLKDAENYDICKPNLSAMFMISFMISIVIIIIKALFF